MCLAFPGQLLLQLIAAICPLCVNVPVEPTITHSFPNFSIHDFGTIRLKVLDICQRVIQ